jgi:hypothetical protein
MTNTLKVLVECRKLFNVEPTPAEISAMTLEIFEWSDVLAVRRKHQG